ncbi:hypothetical protein AB3X94_00940 [Paraburkholderia sp. BR10923]|uniref:hypothetical protein n=1 Tax=Paraburkholderia sp. BR10923 TaxID=3236992 RepID=UPI0034D018BD
MSEQTEQTRRGPGRPRKLRPAEVAPVASPVVAPADPLAPVVTDRAGAGKIVHKSPSTIKRLEKSDPDWPKPFSVGAYEVNYLIADIHAYVLKKARA